MQCPVTGDLPVEIPVKGSFRPMLVDAADADFVRRFKWYLDTNGYPYANLQQSRKSRVHRLIMDAKPGQEIDHANRDKLDNRRKNLRTATRVEQQRNRGKRRDNASGYIGVSWDKKSRKWRAVIHHNGKQIHLGCCADKDDAATLYNFAADELFGPFAVMNESAGVA